MGVHLNELGEKILLDRYADKDFSTELQVGDTVVAILDNSSKDLSQKREIGVIEEIQDKIAKVVLKNGDTVSLSISMLVKPKELSFDDVARRVARGVAMVESDIESPTTPYIELYKTNAKTKREYWQHQFEMLMEDAKFVPGGRILTAAGTGQKLTYSNCFVIASPQDSRQGIMKTLTEMAELMSRGGGVGINVSSLRPKNAYVKGVNGRSSGSVSWAALYSFVTGLIEQGGCFGANERIATDKGLIPALELVERIESGETFFAHTHKGLRKITAKFRNGKKELYEVTTSRGYKVQVTQDHKIATMQNNEIITVPLRFLESGSEILLLTNNEINQTYSNLNGVSHDENETKLSKDVIINIQEIGISDVYDFEVEDVHLLSANGIYTSNSRRGALMLQLDDWHPDVFRFISAKRQAGKIENANISVTISESFMKAVKEDLEWQLRFPDTEHTLYDSHWNGQLDEWESMNLPVVPYGMPTQNHDEWDKSTIVPHGYPIKAKAIWDAIIESAWASAEPGLWFKERSNIMSNSNYYKEGKLIATNPCVTGDTRIYTNKGLIKAEDLFNKETEISVVVDKRFGFNEKIMPASRVFYTGKKDVFEIETKHGFSIKATENHKFMTPNGWVELKDLKVGDKLHILNQEGAFGKEGTYEIGLILGKQAVRSIDTNNKKMAHNDNTYAATQKEAMVLDKVQIITEDVWQGTKEMQVGFINGAFNYAETTLNKAEKSIELLSSNVDVLREIQMILSNFGIESKVEKYGNTKLVVSNSSLKNLAQKVKFLNKEKQNEINLIVSTLDGYCDDKYVTTIQGITYVGKEPVYDLTEPVTHSFIANGIVVHNCGEEPLSAYASCNLGAINLSKFETNGTLDEELLYKAAYIGARFLDDVLDDNKSSLSQTVDKMIMERRIGLGVMGLAELMIKCGIRYGSKESGLFTEHVFHIIARGAYHSSIDSAIEKGSFPYFEANGFLNSGYMLNMDNDIRNRVKEHGIRNVTLLTVAPTGSTATMVNTSTGVEPFFSWKFYRKSRLGLHEQWVDLALPYVENGKELPEYFVTAMELQPSEHVVVQAAAQRWNDSAISKTLNAPNDYTIEQTNELYMQLYDMGCKGGTIYRDGSRHEQVLTTNVKEEKKDETRFKWNVNGETFEIDKSDVYRLNATLDQYINGIVSQAVLNERRAVENLLDLSEKTGRAIRPEHLHAVVLKGNTPFGTAFITISEDEKGNPFEVFITIGKSGSDIMAQAESIGRMLSISMQMQPVMRRMDMLIALLEQNRGIGGARQDGFGEKRVQSFPDAISKIIQEQYVMEKTKPLSLTDMVRKIIAKDERLNGYELVDEDDTNNPIDDNPNSSLDNRINKTISDVLQDTINSAQIPNIKSVKYTDVEKQVPENIVMRYADICPECGNNTLLRADGCSSCSVCGHSEC